ncbi:50S ribosomal protein L23 [Candidatus Azambacteria bacterium]|nr:50S ribosomal protein L23 [Candidatus Azambacteria bacterium]
MRQYVFRVAPRANKIEIARAVENLYGVTVIRVGTVRVPGKVRRRGRYAGFRPGYKKAIVTLKEGESIELMPK